MLSFLNQPFPKQDNKTHSIIMSCVASICVFAIFFFIRPFGLAKLASKKIAIIGLQYGLVTLLLSLFCTVIITEIFYKKFNEKHWKVYNEILFLFFIIFTIALGNLWLTCYLFKATFSLSLFLNMLQYTFVFGLLPIIISVIVKQQILLQKYSAEAKQIENTLILDKKNSQINVANAELNINPIQPTDLIEKEDHTTLNIILNINGNNQTEHLAIAATNFIFAEAADNYTIIHFKKDDLQKHVLFRMSIKTLETQSKEATNIFRCHKSFMVNLAQVKHITGNAQGYKLQLNVNASIIPVSRSLNAIIKEKLANL